MPILNYTTTIKADKTVGEIQSMLAKAGARQVMATYGTNGVAEAVAFAIETPVGLTQFHLPVAPDRVLAVLKRDRVASRYRNIEQAERVAWRILKDWLAAQLAIIQSEMVTLEQVMLPYMHGPDGRSVYQLFLDQKLALTPGDEVT